MIRRSGDAVSLVIQFPSGHPDGNVTWRLLNGAGTQISTGTITPPGGAVSTIIQIDASLNTLGGSVLYDYRDVLWTYAVGGVVVADEERYSLEARIPYGVSYDGVRSKLSVSKLDIPDDEISLVRAYLVFQDMVTAAALTAFTPNDLGGMQVRDGIEALAAITFLPAIKARVALREGSGTDSFERDTMDWDIVRSYLYSLASDAALTVNPLFDQTINFGSLLTIAIPPVDPITGSFPV